jgi:hypothetical protein
MTPFRLSASSTPPNRRGPGTGRRSRASRGGKCGRAGAKGLHSLNSLGSLNSPAVGAVARSCCELPLLSARPLTAQGIGMGCSPPVLRLRTGAGGDPFRAFRAFRAGEGGGHRTHLYSMGTLFELFELFEQGSLWGLDPQGVQGAVCALRAAALIRAGPSVSRTQGAGRKKGGGRCGIPVRAAAACVYASAMQSIFRQSVLPDSYLGHPGLRMNRKILG